MKISKSILKLTVLAMLIALGVVISPILRVEGMCPMAHFTYDVTPGVSSVFGAAATLNAEFTLPGISQTLIISTNVAPITTMLISFSP